MFFKRICGRKVFCTIHRVSDTEWNYTFWIEGSDLAWTATQDVPSRKIAAVNARVHAEECIRQLQGEY